MNKNTLLLAGHRGFGCTDHDVYTTRPEIQNIPPENTLESYAKAFETGAQYVELDVIASADGIAFICHKAVPNDHFFTDSKPTQNLNHLTYAEISSYPVGRHKKGQAPKLADALKLITEKSPKTLSLDVNIELKGVMDAGEDYDGDVLIEAVKKVVVDANFPEERILFSSFALDLVLKASHAFPKAQFGMLFTVKKDDEALYACKQNNHAFRRLTFTKQNIGYVVKIWKKEAKEGVALSYAHPEMRKIKDRHIELIKSLGLGLNIWTFLEKPNAINVERYKYLQEKCISAGVPVTFITDYLTELKDIERA